jgi:hypothetical protein
VLREMNKRYTPEDHGGRSSTQRLSARNGAKSCQIC